MNLKIGLRKTFGSNRCLTSKTKKEMKKNLFMVAAVALMAMVSCNKIENNNGGEEVVVPTIPFEFTAYASEDAATSAETQQPAMAQKVDTKASLVTVEGKPKTHWEATDKINVNGFEFTLDTKSEFGAGARFVGNVVENFGTEYKAVYPSTAGTWDAVTVKSSQKAKAGTFDPEALVAVAYSNTDNVLAFKHVTSLLKFRVPADCEIVTISSDDALAGTITVNGITADGVDYTVTNGTTAVTVTGPFKINTDYYISVLPGLKNNFKIKLDNYTSKEVPSVNPKRSVIMKMGELPTPTEWEWFMTDGTSKRYMVKSTKYTDLLVASKVSLGGTDKKFHFVNRDGTKKVGAYDNNSSAITDVDCQNQINSWYDSQSANTHDGYIYVTTSENYDVYFSTKDLNFLIIKTGVEEVDTDWALVGTIAGQDLWNSTKHKIKLNYILVEKSITIDLTNKDYFKFLKNNNWTAGGADRGWIAGYGNDDNGTTDLNIANNATSTYGSHRSWGDYRSRFHMTNNGTYKITLVIDEGNAYGDATITFKRLK